LASATGSSQTICSILFPRTRISAGPIAGVPAPSIIVALRITSDSARLPDVGVCAGSEFPTAVSATASNSDFDTTK